MDLELTVTLRLVFDDGTPDPVRNDPLEHRMKQAAHDAVKCALDTADEDGFVHDLSELAGLQIVNVSEALRLSADEPSAGRVWLPMTTAPKTGEQILVRTGHGSKFVAQWNEDKHSKRPRPYWDYVCGLGRNYMWENPPVGWLPIPNADQKDSEYGQIEV